MTSESAQARTELLPGPSYTSKSFLKEMLPADKYRPGSYPPGPNWPSFGDPYLQRAFRGLSAEANVTLQDKHERMRQLHKDRLDKQGFSSIPPPWQPPDAPSGGGPPRERQAALAGPEFQESLEWPTSSMTLILIT